MNDVRGILLRHATLSAFHIASDLTALLNRASDIGVAICPNVDTEGIDYSIEWVIEGERVYLDVEWDAARKRWIVGTEKEEKK
jgi:hypothetical protein